LVLVECWGTTGDNFEVEANADSLRLRFAKGHILTEFRIPVSHGLVSVPDPEAQQVFRSSLLSKMRDAKSPEGMKSGFFSLHAGKDRVKAASQYARLRERTAAGRAEDKTFLPAVNEVSEHRRRRPSQVHLSGPALGLWRL
jgi:hypothetical protein